LTPATSFPESAPFLLVRPSDRDVTDVLDNEEDADAKSVPPRPPPSSVRTTEQSLPSVIVDIRELEAAAAAEEERVPSADVDVLLEDISTHATLRDSRRVQTLPSIEPPPMRTRLVPRALAIALVSAAVVAGTVVCLGVHHVSPGDLRAALHLAR
jgi:hypothetical protein